MRHGRRDPGKYMGTYTARGTVTENESEQNGPTRIRLFDGKFNTGFVVREFYVWGATYSNSSGPDVIGKLATSPNCLDTPVDFMLAADSREIAWSGHNGGLDFMSAGEFHIIDPENLIVEDLWFYARGVTDTVNVNYMIVMDKYDITDTMGVVTMAKDRATDSEGQWIA
jgi:hypothetical protein